jgi:hypothetical protein
MKKAQARTKAMSGQTASKSAKAAGKKPIAMAARARSAVQKAPTAKRSPEREGMVDLVEIASDMRQLLGEIRDLLAEREEEEETGEVDTMIVEEAESPESVEEESMEEE